MSAVLTTTTPRRRSRLRTWPWLPMLLLAPMVLCGLIGAPLFPHDPTEINFPAAGLPPAFLPGGDWHYLLGTDQTGRDLLSRLMEGARVSLVVSVIGVCTAAAIGVPIGMLAGYFGRWVDNLVMRLADIQMSIPATLLTILFGAALGGGLQTILVSIALVFWADYARVVRGETLVIANKGYVQLARVAAAGTTRILARHVLPNVMPTIVVLMTLQVGRALIVEAAITFIGLGVQPPDSAWGLMVAEGRAYLDTAWWIPAFAGLAIVVTVLGANLLGDWLRDKLDPKAR